MMSFSVVVFAYARGSRGHVTLRDSGLLPLSACSFERGVVHGPDRTGAGSGSGVVMSFHRVRIGGERNVRKKGTSR